MKDEWVMVMLEVPLKAIDFSDCGDGCGEVYGLSHARLNGLPILSFAADDQDKAREAMLNELGETPRRFIPSQELVDEMRAEHGTDLLSLARAGR